VPTKIFVFIFFLAHFLQAEDADLEMIGKKIWRHECEGSVEGLTTWNEGEEFPSLGIGHFIWYAEKNQAPFEETFPQLLDFLEQKGASPPIWLKDHRECPWHSRKEFLEQFDSQEMQELRYFLETTTHLQTQFMILRFERAFQKLIANLSEMEKKHVETQFQRIHLIPSGDYVLIDYLNFKGDGVSSEERYQGKGWGLLQVFKEMKEMNSVEPIEEFVRAAKGVLRERIRNAPPDRREERWLEGWFCRLETYLNLS
jgi:hypothetical protein